MISSFFRTSALWQAEERDWLKIFQSVNPFITGVRIERGFLIDYRDGLERREADIITWLLRETFEPKLLGMASQFRDNVLEVGPRLEIVTPKSSNTVLICHACGLNSITRVEQTRRFAITMADRNVLSAEQEAKLYALIHDRMTEQPYLQPIKSFDPGRNPEPVNIIPAIEQGPDAIQKANKELGLAMDEQDIEMYYDLFVNQLRRNPTDVELFQLGQSNSEHSRHGFFCGNLVIDGIDVGETLMEIVKAPWKANPGNSLIGFHDDSSAIRGSSVVTIMPIQPGDCSVFVSTMCRYHPTLTAETHNFPSGVAPFPGAETGTGGRIRDNQAVGRGGLVIAAGAAYCTGNLHIPGYDLEWEQDGWEHPPELAAPLQILIQASNGASDYGNKFGEPVIYGFTRTCGIQLPDGYRSWYKPIMYTVGAGQIDDRHITKGKPEKGMLLVQIGGPAFRIGLGGGAASSMIQGDNVAELDFNAVQRGDAQVEQNMNRLIRACIELGKDNPFVTFHDLGAGGDCNALTELVDPAGALINLREIPLGDITLSVLEYWGNESQERHAFLVWPDSFDAIKTICDREGIPCFIVGKITGDGWLIVHDESDGTDPVKLPLKNVLGELPSKTFNLERVKPKREPLSFSDYDFTGALLNILRLPSVGSKRFLTTKVDRSVTGLIAQQQCVGPNQLTLCDYAVIAQSHFSLNGVALSLGEQPLKGLISPQAMARMAVAEALLNMAGAKISRIQDIKCSANWMLAAKLPGEGAWLYDAACALRNILIQIGSAIDGGKDSLSMAAKTNDPDGVKQTVKAPGQLVIANYAPMSDINCKVTPDLKKEGSSLFFIDLSCGKKRLGGSALAQVYGQVGDECPDVEDVDLLVRTFETVQKLIEKDLILSIHDRSDGGLITCLLEMAFAGNLGFSVGINTTQSCMEDLFNEELGLVIETDRECDVLKAFEEKNIPIQLIGKTLAEPDIMIREIGGERVFNMLDLRQVWEQTSSEIDRLQANPECVEEDQTVNATLTIPPPYNMSFTPTPTPHDVLHSSGKPKVAIFRAEGSNGDREMASAFHLAGFDAWDVTLSDLITGAITLDKFRGVAFVGGFTYADVLDAGKGWAGAIRFNEKVSAQFTQFYSRQDTFSLGVCNGCQVMALLGWVPWYGIPDEKQPRFVRNVSRRFESRFATVGIMPSPSIFLKDMEESVLGIHVAHGEGQSYWPDEDIFKEVLAENLAPIRYVDRFRLPTETYPHNPNGSPMGIAALCSPDGRHLAMMPHPERVFLKWQWHYWPPEWKDVITSPWIKLFQNAREWCDKN